MVKVQKPNPKTFKNHNNGNKTNAMKKKPAKDVKAIPASNVTAKKAKTKLVEKAVQEKDNKTVEKVKKPATLKQKPNQKKGGSTQNVKAKAPAKKLGGDLQKQSNQVHKKKTVAKDEPKKINSTTAVETPLKKKDTPVNKPQKKNVPAANKPQKNNGPAMNKPQKKNVAAANRPQKNNVPAMNKPQKKNVPAANKPQKNNVPAMNKPQKKNVPAANKPQKNNDPAMNKPQKKNVPAINKPQKKNVPAANKPQNKKTATENKPQMNKDTADDKRQAPAPSMKAEKKQFESQPFDEDNFNKIVNRENIKKIAQALKSLVEKEVNEKKTIFSDYRCFLHVCAYRIANCPKRIVKLNLKHSLVDCSVDDVAIIVPDLQRGAMVDYEPTIQHYEDLFREAGVTGLKIVPFNQLRKECTTFEAKRKFASSYDYLLCDGRIVSHVVGFCGSLSQKSRSTLHSVRLNDPKTFKRDIEHSLKRSSYKQLKKGDLTSIAVGNHRYTVDELADNILTVVEQLKTLYPGGLANIRNMHLKIDFKGLASLPLYVNLGGPPAETPNMIGLREKRMIMLKKEANKILTQFSLTKTGDLVKLNKSQVERKRQIQEACKALISVPAKKSKKEVEPKDEVVDGDDAEDDDDEEGDDEEEEGDDNEEEEEGDDNEEGDDDDKEGNDDEEEGDDDEEEGDDDEEEGDDDEEEGDDDEEEGGDDDDE